MARYINPNPYGLFVSDTKGRSLRVEPNRDRNNRGATGRFEILTVNESEEAHYDKFVASGALQKIKDNGDRTLTRWKARANHETRAWDISAPENIVVKVGEPLPIPESQIGKWKRCDDQDEIELTVSKSSDFIPPTYDIPPKNILPRPPQPDEIDPEAEEPKPAEEADSEDGEPEEKTSEDEDDSEDEEPDEDDSEDEEPEPEADSESEDEDDSEDEEPEPEPEEKPKPAPVVTRKATVRRKPRK